MMGEDMSIPLGASVGAIMVPKQGNDYHSLLKQADKALYKVKKNGKHGYQIYSSNAFSEEDANPENLTIRELSEILGERNIPEVALQLEMDAFSYVYRYVIRYIARHNVTASKVLYTLEPAEGVSDEEYKDFCDEFGNHVRQCLRKSDILTRSRYNQYYVFLTDIREEYSDIVISQVIDSWNLENPAKLTITYESETIHNRFDLYTEPGERRVYIVDDDEMILSQAKEILEVNGIAVFTFSSGKELISSLESEEKKPDLILLDIKMPEMDGFETLEKIRTFSDRIANTPVIFLTGDDSEILESKGFSMGAIDFIRKPIVPEITLLRVNHILELVALRKRVHK